MVLIPWNDGGMCSRQRRPGALHRTPPRCGADSSAGGKVLQRRLAGKWPQPPILFASQTDLGGAADGFVAVFDDSGTLLWSAHLRGGANDSIDLALPLPDGSVVVVGTTDSADFPSLQPSPLDAGNSFIAHLRRQTTIKRC